MEDIIQEIENFKGNRVLPNIKKYNSEYDVEKHEIFTNISKYPDRIVESSYFDEKLGKEVVTKTIIPLNRIGLPYQKKIVSIATTFFCGIPIKYTNNIENDELYNSFLKVIKKNKMEFIDRSIITSKGRYTECAELWYHTNEDNEYYGFDSKFRLRVKILSPETNHLYPVFDEDGDLISFSREFKTREKTIFEAYTKDFIKRYELINGQWILVKDIINPIGKIPIVYHHQESVEWAEASTSIARLEQIYSYSTESNDRFAFPILKIKGSVNGKFHNDRTGRVFELDRDADMEFVNQHNATENISIEINRLERDVHDFTATPNISFDNMKGLGNMLAGSSAKFLFLSAHLKVYDKLSEYIPALLRRVSIIEAYLKEMNIKFKENELDVEPIITPFVINNEAEFVRFLMEANGNKPIYSQSYSMELAGVKNPKQMLDEIDEEEEKANSRDLV